MVKYYSLRYKFNHSCRDVGPGSPSFVYTLGLRPNLRTRGCLRKEKYILGLGYNGPRGGIEDKYIIGLLILMFEEVVCHSG